tara:strand:+ start:229 stop:741 length:513 start_codon:yes stop_codon:yes gene_type:complete
MSTLKVGTIQDHANSITALSINSAGVLTTGVKHAFYMYRNTAQTINHAAGPIVVQFDQQRINEGNGVTLGASARYTVPSNAGGIYVLHGHSRLNSGNDGNASVGIFVNGSAVATAYYYNQYYDGYNVSFLRNMAAGDYVELRVANSTGGNLAIGQPDAGDTVFMWGYRLG